jgi:hypothetical protein
MTSFCTRLLAKGKNITVGARFVHQEVQQVEKRKDKKDFSIFKARLVDKDHETILCEKVFVCEKAVGCCVCLETVIRELRASTELARILCFSFSKNIDFARSMF